MQMRMTGTSQIPLVSSGDGYRCCASPVGMDEDVVGLVWGCKRNVEFKMHLTLLCLQLQKRICQQLPLNRISIAM